MDTKRRMRDLELPTTTHQPPSPSPWPVLQRRRIEKLKDDRLHEFERACDESFEWLENYYQGCVYAALQNKHYNETGTFGRSLSTDHGESRQSQHFTTDQQYEDGAAPFSPYASGYYSGQGRSTISPGHSQSQRRKSRHTPKNSPARFRLKSPKTPNISSGYPISPFDRHRHTTPRKKLRVTARPSTMRAQRALKAMRKRTASLQKDTTSAKHHHQHHHRDSKISQQYRVSGTEDATSRDVGTIPSKDRQSRENPKHTSQDSTLKQANYQSRDTQPRHTSAPAEDESSFTSEADKSFYTETSTSTFKTPAKGQTSRSNYSRARSADDMEIDSDHDGYGSTPGSKARDSMMLKRTVSDMGVDSDAGGYDSTPGSKARDSMTLKSPLNRADTSKDEDMESPLRSAIVHGSAHNRPSSVAKRSSNDIVETDQDRTAGAEPKRSKSSPFVDSLVTVRFGSPEAEARATKSDGSIRESRTKSTDSTTTVPTRTADMTRTESASRRRELEVQSFLTKNRGADTDARPSATTKSTTPSTTPRMHPDIDASRSQRPSASDDLTRAASVRNSALDGPSDTGVSRSTHVKSSASHGQANGEFTEHRVSGTRSSSEQTAGADSSSRGQVVHSTTRPLPGKDQDDRPPWRQADRKEEIDTSATNQAGRTGAGDETDHSSRIKPTVSKPDSTAFSSSFAPSSDAGSLRTKMAMTLPEKRILGQRKPNTTSSQASASVFMLPSRLTKLPLATSFNTAGPSTSASSATQPDATSATQSSSNNLPRVGTQSTLKDTQLTSGVGSTATKPPTAPANASTSTSSLLGRHGVPPRAPLTTTRTAVDGTSTSSTTNGFTRSDSQNSLLTRKPFSVSTAPSTNKSAFSLKKPTVRPVLPDGVSSTKTHFGTSGSSGSLAMMQARMDQHSRETTPSLDLLSKSSLSTQRTDSKPAGSTTKTTASLSSVLSSRKEATAVAANGVGTETVIESTQSFTRSTTEGGHKFAIPAPVRQPMIPQWLTNQAERQTHHEKTILPEIQSDGEDHDQDDQDSASMSKKRKANVPSWATWEELESAMEDQKHLNPEEIFGPLPVLDVGEIFPGREKKSFRPRTSSAHWGAADALTPQEVIKYNQDMGWGSNE
ncbi:hypothetical protein BGX33_012082 [Mortierella sp. NVP41]|nr:hypothetical protein BGX33_012082 [Mortierella sp. NVP41]